MKNKLIYKLLISYFSSSQRDEQNLARASLANIKGMSQFWFWFTTQQPQNLEVNLFIYYYIYFQHSYSSLLKICSIVCCNSIYIIDINRIAISPKLQHGGKPNLPSPNQTSAKVNDNVIIKVRHYQYNKKCKILHNFLISESTLFA